MPPPFRARVVNRNTRRPVRNATVEVLPAKPAKPGEKPADAKPHDLGRRGRLTLPPSPYHLPEALGVRESRNVELVFRAPGYVPGKTRLEPKNWNAAWHISGLRPCPTEAEGEPGVEELPPPKIVAPGAFSAHSMHQHSSGVVLGFRPLVHMDRTLLREDLDLQGAGGIHAGMAAGGGPLLGTMSLNYVPLEGEDSDEDVDAYWFDAGLSGAIPLTDDEPALTPALRIGIGPSLLFMDFERSTYDTGGIGFFLRTGLGLWGREERFALEAIGDVHGWVGVDSHQTQAAWAGTVGVQLVVRF
jgi:hypothetical protein